MKKRVLFISSLLFTGILLFSCASNSVNEAADKNQEEKEAIIEEISLPEPSPQEIFLESIKDIKIQFTNSPAKTKKGKAFTSSYDIFVAAADQPLADFDLTLKVPEKKEGNQIVFTNITLTTDENGKASYMPETPKFAAKTTITAGPAIPEGLEIDNSLLEAYNTSADFLSESDIVTKGAILFVFEFNENGKSPKNSYDILSGLRKKGVSMIGNAPISDTAYINASKTKIYQDNYEYVGSDYGYLIGGTVKYVNPVEKNEDGSYTAHMIAEIYGIEMKTGNIIFEGTKENIASGANWSKAVENCKTKLTADIVDDLMFGL